MASVVQGGKFKHGFLSAAFTQALGGTIKAFVGKALSFSKDFARAVAGAIVGGTASRLSGGKFANGAVTGAFIYTFREKSNSGGGSSSWTSEDIAAREASAAVYNDDGGLLGELGIAYDPQDGFAASLSVDESGKYILAFRGTEGPGDWPTNFKQGFGLSASQYRQAMTLAADVYQATGGDVLFVGHSLGGGLASAAAFSTPGGRAITFNAAGLHPFTASGAHSRIRAHYIRGDILSVIQDFTPLPNAAGIRIAHPGQGSMMDRHGIGQF